MNAKVFCLASAKGGSGKTILTANLATFLTDIGKKCLVIDCDAATHGMTLLYLVEVAKNTKKPKDGLFELSTENQLEDILKNSIIKVENGVDLLPATYNFRSGFDPEERFEENLLHRIVDLLRSSYDVIFLDAQAGSDKYARLAMSKNVCEQVIIVSEYDPLSAAGIERLKKVIGDDLDYTRTWILLNKMLPEFVEKFSEFLSIAKYLPPIPWNADVVRSYAKRKLALDVEKGNVFTLSIMRTVSALLKEEVQSEIDKWSEKRSYALKEPLDKQYIDAEKELRFVLQAQNDLKIKHKKRQLIRIYAGIIPLLIVSYIFYINVDNGIYSESLKRMLNLNEIDSFNNGLLLIMAGLGLIAPFLYFFTSKIFNIEKTAESAKYSRQIDRLQERLKQLETLRAADLKTIIKTNFL